MLATCSSVHSSATLERQGCMIATLELPIHKVYL